VEKHFVAFYSPGTLVSEQDELPIDSWDVDVAVSMAKDVRQRHSAVPYAFRFSTRCRTDDELDSRVARRSPTYFLGGTVLTLQDVLSRNDPNDKILIGNMKSNGYERVLVNDNSWRATMPLFDGDVVLDMTPDDFKQAHQVG